MILLMLATFLGGPPASDGRATVPGVVNMAVTQDNIASTICVANWTKTIRPPSSYTNKLKRKLMNQAGIPWPQSRSYELDHDISLEVGGNPSDPNNLWLQPYNVDPGAHQKDHLENLLHKLVCSGKETLKDAQTEISIDWIAAYTKHFGKAP